MYILLLLKITVPAWFKPTSGKALATLATLKGLVGLEDKLHCHSNPALGASGENQSPLMESMSGHPITGTANTKSFRF